MSRSALRNIALVVAFSATFTAPIATAQEQTPEKTPEQTAVTAKRALANAEEAYGPPPPKKKCDPQEGDEIVVCAEEQEQSQFRVKSSNELDPTSEEAIKDGLPRAPDVGGAGIFKGPATIGGMCLIPPCPAPPALIIDVTALPEAPAGSDADRISRGLPPLGRDQKRTVAVDVLPTKRTEPEQPETESKGEASPD